MTISASSTTDLLVEQKGHILVLTMNRPDRLNAISRAMIGELAVKLREANRDASVRVVVLTGAGKGFCSGLDLKDAGQFLAGNAAGSIVPQSLLNLDNSPITALWDMDKPVIAAVNGAAAGFGMDMALLADIRLMSESAKFAATMVKRNVVPESGGTWTLPRLIGWARAADILYRGRIVDAQESLKVGLANEVVSGDQLLATAMRWAEEIAANAPLAVQTTKRMMRLGQQEDFPTTVDHLMMHFIRLSTMDDFKEALLAFNEKRAPQFKGR